LLNGCVFAELGIVGLGLLVELLLVGVVVVFDVSEIALDGSEDVLGRV
jgi:hypothetical protein